MIMTAAAIALSYVLGSIPTGLWLGLWLKGVDIRQRGSQNIGATNTMRVLGKPLGAVALVGDAAKGVAAVLLAAPMSDWHHAPLACGLAAIAGHGFSVFLRFRGGKGVATSAGVFAALAPLATGLAAAAFLAVTVAARMVSAGSIAAAVTLAAAIFLVGDHDPVLQAVVTAVAIFVVVKHRSNIQRIMRGEENRLW